MVDEELMADLRGLLADLRRLLQTKGSSVQKRGLTREEAADYAGVSVYKIKAAIRDNRLVARQHGKDIVVFREDLDEWMDTWEAA